MVTEVAGKSQDMSQEMQVVSLKEAARALGIGESAVRKRLAKGLLQGEKDEVGHWTSVMLPVGVSPEEAAEKSENLSRDEREYELLQEMIDLYREEVAARERENEFLRQRLANMEILLGQSLQNTKALLPPEPQPEEETPEPEPEPEPPRKRKWWQFGGLSHFPG